MSQTEVKNINLCNFTHVEQPGVFVWMWSEGHDLTGQDLWGRGRGEDHLYWPPSSPGRPSPYRASSHQGLAVVESSENDIRSQYSREFARRKLATTWLGYANGRSYWWGWWTTTRMKIDGCGPVPNLPPSLLAAPLYANIRRKYCFIKGSNVAAANLCNRRHKNGHLIK